MWTVDDPLSGSGYSNWTDSVAVQAPPGSYMLGRLRLHAVRADGQEAWCLFLADLGSMAIAGSFLDGEPAEGLGLRLTLEVRRLPLEVRRG